MDNIPTHIGIILDGNRRWAKKRGLPSGSGHKEAVKRIEELIEHAATRGVDFLTFYTFSTENWGRTPSEVSLIMNLFREYFNSKSLKKLIDNGVKIIVIGDSSRFDEDIQKNMLQVMEDTADNKKITVNFALNYGGRAEIIYAINRIITEGKKEVSEEEFSNYLYTAKQPDPDLIIRTSGEKRISGFLLWQIAYSELYFTDVLMPDFTAMQLDIAIAEYESRKRRFGK